MFHQYFQLEKRIRKHYVSPRVLMCLATGRFVPPLHRQNLYSLQYSMLPARRAPVLEMWNALTGGSGQESHGKDGKRKTYPWSSVGKKSRRLY